MHPFCHPLRGLLSYFFDWQGLGASRLASLACYALTGRPLRGFTPAFYLSPAPRAGMELVAWLMDEMRAL